MTNAGNDANSVAMRETSIRRQAAAFTAVRRAALATEAARRAGVTAITKDDKSPVTVADFASQAIVARVLAHLMGHPLEATAILGEESDAALRETSNAPLLEAVVRAADAAEEGIEADEILAALAIPSADPRHGPCWTLDPVDGTKGFLRGGQYAIALAWLEGGRPTEGALGCPCLDLEASDLAAAHPPGVVASARRGDGARLMRFGEDPRPTRIQCRPWSPGDPIRLALSLEAAHGDADTATRIAGRIGAVTPVRLDSACKYLLVAAGLADAYLRIPRDASRAECAWDHAAGVLVAEEAGCTVCDLDGKPLDFGRGPTLTANRGVIVASPRLAAALVAAQR